jgi:AcrR family transcriptional regulator
MISSMKKKPLGRGVSKAEWLEAGLEFLSRGSVSVISVEGLAKHLKIAKSGFYWHFKNRDELLRELLAYWLHEITEVVTVNREILAMDPRVRLQKTAEMLHDYRLTRYEMGIRQWALEDKGAAKIVRKANRMRMGYLMLALSELGIEGAEAEMRAMTYLCYMTWELHTFPEVTRKKRRSMIASRVKMLTTV